MEFGSDYNLIDYPKGNGLPLRCQYNTYASGRQPLLHLVEALQIKRIWVPTYYCGESLEVLDRCAISVKRYPCTPENNPDDVLCEIPCDDKDLVVRVNYFGAFGWHDSQKSACIVAEDHTHDLTGEWAQRSNADYCFASLRKTLPTADGGILWSPGGLQLPCQPALSAETAMTMQHRWGAMADKTAYLNGNQIEKSGFLNRFRQTEEKFSVLSMSDCSDATKTMLSDIDMEKWYGDKKNNYLLLLKKVRFKRSKPFITELKDTQTPFSFVVVYGDKDQRDRARYWLIQHNIYPAILWPDVVDVDKDKDGFADRMLSIHCDARYSAEDIELLADILNKVL